MSAFMNRRQAIRLGAGLGALAATGFAGGYWLLPPSRSRNLESVHTLAARFYTSLNDD